MTSGLWSVLIQAIGSAATLGAAAFVTWHFGLSAQGEFGLLRSWSDSLVALAALGLPQGLLHLQYREAVSAASLRRFVGRYVGALAVGCAVVVAVLVLTALGDVAGLHRTQVGIIVAAAPFGVAHLLCRALVLKTRGVVRYGIVTSLPSVLVLLGIVVFGIAFAGAGIGSSFAWVLLGAAVLSSGVAALWSSGAQRRPEDPVAWPRRILWSVSLQTWLQAALATVLVASLLTLSRALGAGLVEVGLLSLGLYVYQLFGVLAAYAAPVVYDRVAGASAAQAVWTPSPSWRKGAFGVATAALAIALVAPRLAAFAWPAASQYVSSMTFFAVAGLAALGARLGATLLQAMGRLTELSIQAAWRLVVALALTAALLSAMTAASAVPVALLAVELLTLARVAWLLRAGALGARATGPVER
ncbi:MAG: hypothetical protein ABI641_12445 [Caldimonas sp.]